MLTVLRIQNLSSISKTKLSSDCTFRLTRAALLSTFKKRVKSILKTELNAKNVLNAIGEYAVPVLTYTFGVINWTEQEIKDADIHVRKQLNMFRMFEIRSDVDRLYVPRMMGGRGLMSIWDSFKSTLVRLAHYMNHADDKHIKACAVFDKNLLFSITKKAEKFAGAAEFEMPKDLANKPILKQAKIIAKRFKEATSKDRYEKFVSKPQHGVHFRQMTEYDIDMKSSLKWLEKCHLSPQSESYICGMQELAIFTRWHEKNILKTNTDDTCRVCKKETETTSHILAGCDTLAKKEYLERHNRVANYVHYEICKKYNIQTEKKWHLHCPAEVYMDNKVEILWDMILTTDREVGANRPDIVVRDKLNGKVYIIDISCPSDTNVIKKENEKISKYSGLRVELGKMWKSECVVVPVVIGGLGCISPKFANYLRIIPANISIEMCLKLTLIGSEKIMRSFLSRK